MRLPSIKTFCAAFRDLTKEDAKLLRSVLSGEVIPDDMPEKFPDTNRLIRQCYHRPSESEIRMFAANELLELFGTEAVFEGSSVWPWLEYCNTGEMYTPTLCLYDGRYIVASVGDILEKDKRIQARG